MPNDTDPQYRIRCLEKENDRLVETVKHIRQNALALVAAVLLLLSALLQNPAPLVAGLNKAKYEGKLQACLLGGPLTPEREAAVQRVTLIWNLATVASIVCGGIAILIAILIFMKTGEYTPVLDKEFLESMTSQAYENQLLDQYERLKGLIKGYRWRLIAAASSAVLMVAGCAVLSLFWLWFGSVGMMSP